MEKIQSAEAKDYEQIQRFLEDAYGHSYNAFLNMYPALWHKDTTDYRHIYSIREEGRIVSLVRLFPLDLILGPVSVKVAGIGSVSTSPSVRGKGYMNRLMEHATAKMKEEGFPISVLSGDRHRYQTFGYEEAGTTLNLVINRRGLHKTGVKPIFPQRYSGQENLLVKISAAYEKNHYRKIRTKEEYALLYQKPGLLLFSAGDDKDFGYLALSGEHGAGGCAEFGGSAQTIMRITGYVMERFGLSSLNFFFPDKAVIPEPILQAASGWNITSSTMLKIVDLEKTLSLFAPQHQERKIPDLASLKTVPETEQVSALFSTFPGSPFNIFLWPLDHI
ncbi:MAG: GNAT family N-acetyltransferase [Candidatus Omnitrophica bacterium]|nr:GNAT family N-acetyltransferase [Candidatus Omnitrophota bacterium]